MIERSPQSAESRPVFTKRRLLVGLSVATGVLLLVVANAHLVYVAMTSQPDCVAHLRAVDETSGSFRAAKSAC